MVLKMIQRMIGISALVLLSACLSPKTDADDLSATQPSDPLPSSEEILENLGPAPELAGSTWLNTDVALSLVNLEGKVVLIDFWTFG